MKRGVVGRGFPPQPPLPLGRRRERRDARDLSGVPRREEAPRGGRGEGEGTMVADGDLKRSERGRGSR